MRCAAWIAISPVQHVTRIRDGSSTLHSPPPHLHFYHFSCHVGLPFHVSTSKA